MEIDSKRRLSAPASKHIVQESGNKNGKARLAESICSYIRSCDQPPSLAKLATHFHLSPYHLQKEFKKTVGISPRQYADELRFKQLKKNLKKGSPVTAALFESGYGSSSSLYDDVSVRMGMTPANYRSGAIAQDVFFSIVKCSLGKLLVATTDSGICGLSISDSEPELKNWLQEEFPQANIKRADHRLQQSITKILSYLSGAEPHWDLPLDIKATAFQRRVYEELRRIPYGSTCSYSEIAESIGHPSAHRAVANACGSNPVPLIIPCHRVVRKGGALGGYGLGLTRKKALLAMESQQND